MAENDLQQQLEQVEEELRDVQGQINFLLEHQGKLLERQTELLDLIECCNSRQAENNNGSDVKPTHQDWAGSFPWDKDAADFLLNVFGIPSYRTNQREIINAALSGRDVVVVMAAGGGKSLCYQLPSLLRPGIALVVSPLLSLIQDQVMGLMALGISASMLTSNTTKEEEKSIYVALEKGQGNLRILYVTPEKVAKSKRFMSKLEKCNHQGRLSLLAIDEAHCCSQWGHDFRPDYKNLGILKRQFPKVPMIALTATATDRVQRDLQDMLQISNCEKFTSSINRPNLFYEVRDKKSNAAAVISDIADFIRDTYSAKESGIVYCFSRKECEQVATELRQQKISAAHYHADMDASERSAVHQRWSNNKLQVIVATVAFGMGINKPDVRFVIHHSLSKSLETYYQESGRAGRDGLPSYCLLFYRAADVPRQSSMVFAEVAGLQNLYLIARYCQSKRTCRRKAFFNHFGEKYQDCNGMCDNCAFGRALVEIDVTSIAKSIMHIVKEMEGNDKKATLLQLVDLWKSHCRRQGSDKQLEKQFAKEAIEQIIVHLILDRFLKEEYQHTAYTTNAYVMTGPRARMLLEGKQIIKLDFEDGKIGKQAPLNKHFTNDDGMSCMLDKIRQKLANEHGGIFPYAILSSQHISMLSIRKPSTLSEVEEVIGKRKTECYGDDILAAIKDYLERNPESSNERSWVDTKASKAAIGKKRKCNSNKEDANLVCLDSDTDEI